MKNITALALRALAGAPLLAATASLALTYDFEQDNPFSGGTLSSEESFTGEQSLWVAPGDELTLDIPEAYAGKEILVSMRVFDMGKWLDTEVTGYPGNAYGPRWGVSTGTHTGAESIGAGILFRTFGGGDTYTGYSLEWGDDRFESWFSTIAYPGASRDHFYEPGTGGSNPGDGWVPGEGGQGEWTLWTFRISADGATTSIQLNDLLPVTTGEAAKDIGAAATQLWLYGGRTGNTTGALSGMYVDDVKILEGRSFTRIVEIEAEDAPVVDGDVDSIFLASQAQAISSISAGSADGPSDSSAQWRAVWDSERLYLIIEIRDQFLEDDASTLAWQNDTIEVYFNMDNFRDPAGNAHEGDNYQYAFHWNKPGEQNVSDNGSYEGVEWAQKDTEDGWTVEASWPWTTLTNLSNVEGYDFGFDIAVIDNDGGTSYDSIYYWNNTGGGLWSNMVRAGTVELGLLFDGEYPPELAPIEVLEAQEGTEATFTVTASDENAGDTLLFTAESFPDFASLTDNEDGTATITVNAEAGDAEIYFFGVSVSDGVTTDSEDVVLIVRDPANPSQSPVFGAVDSVSVDRGQAAEIPVSVTDKDSLETSIAATALPEFVTFTDNGDKTGLVTVSPNAEVEPGDYTVTLTATDEDENTATIDITVTVTALAPRSTFYLDPENGDLANDGSPENPWPSLEEVLDSGRTFAAGDILYLRDGYHGEPRITAANSDYVQIMPDEDAEPRLSKLELTNSSAYWSISGLSISREYAPVFSKETMVSVSGTNHQVRDCEVFTVADATEWTAQQWNDNASNGINLTGSGHLVEDCTVLNTAFSISMAGGSSHITARGNHVQWFSGDGIRPNGDDITVEYNYIADCMNVNDNHDDGIQAWSTGPGGVATGTLYRNVLRGNVIIEATDLDREHRGGLQGIGLFGGMYEDWIIENNVVIVDHWHGISLYGGVNCRIVNNTVVDLLPLTAPGPTWLTLEPLGDKRGSGNIVANNIVTAFGAMLNGSPDYAEVKNNIRIRASEYDTYFVDFPNDMRLKRGAPAINAASAEDAPAIDADGVARPQGSAVDVGAYEWSGTWMGYEMDGEWVSTGGYLGTVYVGQEPWLFQDESGLWFYLDDASASTTGAWVFSAELVDTDLDTGDSGWAKTPIGWVYAPDAPWMYLNTFGAWIYADSASETGAWIYVVNSNPPLL